MAERVIRQDDHGIYVLFNNRAYRPYPTAKKFWPQDNPERFDQRWPDFTAQLTRSAHAPGDRVRVRHHHNIAVTALVDDEFWISCDSDKRNPLKPYL